MIKNKGVTKSLRELWKQYPKLPKQGKKKGQVLSHWDKPEKREITAGLVVGNLVTQQGQSGLSKNQ